MISKSGFMPGPHIFSELTGNYRIYSEEIRGKNLICYSNKKNKAPRNKPNKGGKNPVLRKLHNTEERS